MRLEDRRHSIAVTQQHYVRPITPPLSHPLQQKQKHYQQQHQPPVQHLIQQLQQQQIDEYFSPTTAAIDVQCLGKGLAIDQLEPGQTVYLVQFKGDYRSDWFYVQHDDKIRIQLNEMVIVEADRGYDLGKIIDISQTSCLEKGVTSIKRIFRHANPAELATHQLKQQDEQKALVICQAKIKQKNLNMEVVDAEYQWDRRKLTFYFKANERIDFRELVRELFKIYKTRIWMCAYASMNH
ncbi:PSP1 C-terminal conserved region-domain-containing protein [Mucor lusitanicus]|uniref:PSP1 C-terminal conserved region-domain-containing protein n=2 Tax=Mucor circinelloides f. lusitanicus TaxID=29924 RepID=A0A8H4BM22_MUCCL|nr:PSP1 C-terminal conserved region-domain-containing protein [Mucor lusitanicus]